VNDTGRYRLLQRIGSGGMAEVFEAVAVGDHGFERRVAIKRLLAGSDRQRESMFIDEARIASQLHHANIVAVLDYGVVDGQPFQVLEHVDGIDLGALLARSGPLTAEVALHVCAMIGHALEYAHAACSATGARLGIVHRDVTPGNVLISWAGDVKLTDFGIAFANARDAHTIDGTTKGTPLYMAPEQMLAGEIDRRTDLFALGCVLHAMVVGRSPLAQDQLARLASGAELELDPSLPADIRAIVARATRTQLRDRYGDASELVAAVTQALAARHAADPRSALRATLRGPEAPPVRGKLDALLDGGFDFVLAPSTDDVRHFATVVTRPRTRWWPYAAGGLAIAATVFAIALSHGAKPATGDVFEPHTAEADGIEHWVVRHKPAAHELGAWTQQHPETAAAVFEWDDQHPAAAAELVTWATDSPNATLDAFLAMRPNWRNFIPIATQHRAECDELVAWMRKYPTAAQTLMRHQRGLGWVGRQLEASR
jgi:protein kinase-like protein